VRAAYLGEKLGDTSALESRRRWIKSSAQQQEIGRAGADASRHVELDEFVRWRRTLQEVTRTLHYFDD
jgi:hypothetical protein